MMTLLRRSFGRIARMWVSLLAVLVGFQFALMGAAVSLEQAGDFQRLLEAVPAFIRNTIGPALGSFAGMAVLAYFEPAIILGLVLFSVYVASEPAGDVESGLVDLMLARPLPRHWLISRSLLLMTGSVASLVLGLVAANVMSMWWMAPDSAVLPAPRVVTLEALHLAAVAWCFGGLALAVAASMDRRGAAVGVMALLVVSLYMVHAVEQLSDRFDGVGQISPFYYFQGTVIMQGTAPIARNFTILFGVGAVAVVMAYLQFRRRDL